MSWSNLTLTPDPGSQIALWINVPADHLRSQILEDKASSCLLFRTTPSGQTTGTNSTGSTRFCVVNTQDGLAEVVQTIACQVKPVLYVAIEGKLLVLHVHPEPNCSYIIDLQSLGDPAFEVTGSCKAAAEAEPEERTDGGHGFRSDAGQSHTDSLRTILESKSPSMPKVFFNSRRPCAFLAREFEVHLGSVEDIQCLDMEGRLSSQKQQQQQQQKEEEEEAEGGKAKSVEPRSLRCCLEEDSSLTLAQKRQWVINNEAKAQNGGQDSDSDSDSDSEFEGATDFLTQDRGGSTAWDVKIKARPLPVDVALYCVQQVRHLPGLRERYLGRLNEAGLKAARSRMEKRVGEKKSKTETKEDASLPMSGL